MRNPLLFFVGAVGACLLAGCTPQGLMLAEEPPAASGSLSSVPSTISSAPSAQPDSAPQDNTPDLTGLTHIQNYYICSVIDDTLSAILTDDMTDYDKLLCVYRHLVASTAFFEEPVGTDIWRYRGDPDNLPTVFELRSISPLLFGIGSCEDYASAFVTLCDRMGFPAYYVPGLTYSVTGQLVEHAWAMVRLDGVWYHCDPQLEDNIIKNNVLRYRYFLKSDEQMQTDHRWGDMLTDPSEYAQSLPACLHQIGSPPQETIVQRERPDREQIVQQLAKESAAYLAGHPPLLQIEPPVLPQ